MFDPAFFDSAFFDVGTQSEPEPEPEEQPVQVIHRPLVTTSGERMGYRRRRRTARVG